MAANPYVVLAVNASSRARTGWVSKVPESPWRTFRGRTDWPANAVMSDGRMPGACRRADAMSVTGLAGDVVACTWNPPPKAALSFMAAMNALDVDTPVTRTNTTSVNRAIVVPVRKRLRRDWATEVLRTGARARIRPKAQTATPRRAEAL